MMCDRRERGEWRTGWTGRLAKVRGMKMKRRLGVNWFVDDGLGLIPRGEADQTAGFIMREHEGMRILVGHDEREKESGSGMK